MMKHRIVPNQLSGKAIDAKASTELGSEQAAKVFFKVAKKRLQEINNWHETAKNISAKFKLVDAVGNPSKRIPKIGDNIRIDIPGPGSNAGNGYDWVCIEDIETKRFKDGQSYGIRVRPTRNPDLEGKDVAHFYAPQSSSTFLVVREGTVVSAKIFDRNIEPNTEVEDPIDKIRDTAVGFIGLTVFSKIQWNGLVKGLISV